MFGSALVPFVLHGIVKINKLPALAYINIYVYWHGDIILYMDSMNISILLSVKGYYAPTIYINSLYIYPYL